MSSVYGLPSLVMLIKRTWEASGRSGDSKNCWLGTSRVLNGRGRETVGPLSMVYEATAGGTVALLACTTPTTVMLVPVVSSQDLRFLFRWNNDWRTVERNSHLRACAACGVSRQEYSIGILRFKDPGTGVLKPTVVLVHRLAGEVIRALEVRELVVAVSVVAVTAIVTVIV